MNSYILNDFINDNTRVLLVMYENQVNVRDMDIIPLNQLDIAEETGFSKNKVYSIFSVLQKKNYVKTIGKGKYQLTEKSNIIIHNLLSADKKVKELE